MSLAAARSSIERVLEGCIAAGAPGAIIAIEAPPPGASFSAASGLFARGESRRLRPEDPFRAATVSKAVTAATAVCLAARNYWALDDPVTPFLPPAIRDLLGGLEDLPAIDTSTIRRLLNHTSGLPEYFFDEAFQRRAKAELGRLWCPVELVEAAVATGRLAFPPATDFSYGDTGYVVAGIAIEQVLNSPLGDACRSLVFDPVGMNATCLEWDEPPRGGAVSHHYDGERNLLPLNTSFDRAGGGLVTTAADLVRFLRGLFEESLFDKRWLAELTTWRDELRWRPDSSARYLRYGLGVGLNSADGEEIIGATGVWGAYAYFWPAGDAAIAGTVNLRGADRASLLDAVIRALRATH